MKTKIPLPSRVPIGWKFALSALALLAAITPAANAQELAPDHASIASELGVWFKDAEANFDPKSGVWADSSGNDRHATPVGEVNVNGPITYLSPTLTTVSGGALSAPDLPAVHFSSTVEDLLRASDINEGGGLPNLTIFVVYNFDPLGTNASLCRPVGIGSVAAIQRNLGNNYNLGSDPSIRKDNGNVGANNYTIALPERTTLIRSSRMSPAAIDEWFNMDGNLQLAINVPGSSYTTSTDDFFLGDLRAGVSPIPGVAGGGTSPSDFDIVQTIVYTDALTDAQVAGVNQWLTNNPAGTGGAATGLAFTDVTLSADALTTSLTWRSRPGRFYAVDFSKDLKMNWEEFTDSVESGGAETSFEVTNPVPAETRLYFRVREAE